MPEGLSFPRWSARNPLGIVALFISLIYGMSALLLGASIGKLTEQNQTYLVIFIAVFPFVVLGVFAWLVAQHHQKLYGPADYRSDEGFLNAAKTLPPSALGDRLRKEVERSEPEADGGATSIGKPTPPLQDNRSERQDTVTFAYVIEGLVFQELQSEFSGSIKRQVSFSLGERTLHVDGVLHTDGAAYIVEIKMFRSAAAALKNIGRLANEVRGLISKARDLGFPTILSLVFEQRLPLKETAELMTGIHAALGDNVIVRFFSRGELMSKYGLAKE